MGLTTSKHLGCEVLLRDRPMGNPLKIRGEIIGFSSTDKLVVKIKNGINEGQTIKYYFWEVLNLFKPLLACLGYAEPLKVCLEGLDYPLKA